MSTRTKTRSKKVLEKVPEKAAIARRLGPSPVAGRWSVEALESRDMNRVGREGTVEEQDSDLRIFAVSLNYVRIRTYMSALSATPP